MAIAAGTGGAPWNVDAALDTGMLALAGGGGGGGEGRGGLGGGRWSPAVAGWIIYHGVMGFRALLRVIGGLR